MRLVLTDSRLLRESVSIISELVNEVTIKVDSDKLELAAMDPGSIAMVDYKLLSSAFAEYELKNPTSLSVSLENLKAILRRAKPTDTIILTLDEERNRLSIELVGEHKRVFNLALLATADEEQKKPNLSFPVRVETSTIKFDEAVEDMDVVAESVALGVDKDKFIVMSESNLSDAKVEFPASSETVISSEDKASARYSLEYLKKMIKGSKLSENVVVNFGQDYPLRLDYVVMDKMKLSFILAPRVSND